MLGCFPLSSALLIMLAARAQRAGPSCDAAASAAHEAAWRAARVEARARCAARCGAGSPHRAQGVAALRIIEVGFMNLGRACRAMQCS